MLLILPVALYVGCMIEVPIAPVTPTSIVFDFEPGQSVVVGTVVQPIVRVTGPRRAPVPDEPVTFTITAGGGTITGTPARTTELGVATAGEWTLGTAAGTNVLTATAGQVSVDVTVITIGGPPVSLSMKQVPNTGPANRAVFTNQPIVQLRDQFGNISAQAGVVVTVAIKSGGGTLGGTLTATTNADGVATFSGLSIAGLIGERVLEFTAPNLTSVTTNVTTTAGPASLMELGFGNDQTGTAGANLAVSPSVRITDADGNVVGGRTVVFAVTSGGGSISTPGSSSGANGLASAGNWRLGNTVGTNTITATSTGLTGSPITFTATGVPGAATKLALTPVPSSPTVNRELFATQPVVQVQDANGNAVALADKVVTVALATGTLGTLNGTRTATTGADGRATFTDLSIAGVAGGKTLNFTATGLTTVSVSVTTTAAAATELVAFSGNNSVGTAGGTITPPTVRANDPDGNAVAGVPVTFAVATGGGSVTGATTTTAANGIAAVGTWTLGTVAGSNTMTATSSAIPSATVTFTATGNPGPPTKLIFNTPPSSTAGAGIALAQQPVVQLQDVNSNNVLSAGVTIVASITSGGGTLGGTTSVATVTGGTATFTNLAISGLVGTRTLTFARNSGGLTTVSSSVALSAGNAATIVKSAGDAQTEIHGTTLPTAPAVLVSDASGNPVSGTGVTFAIASGGGITTGEAQTTGPDGIATIGSWTLGTSPGANTLTAASTGLTGSPLTFTATATPGPATNIGVSSGNGGSATVGTNASPAPSVLVTDSDGHGVSGIDVTFAVTAGGGSVTGASQTTNASGVATVGSWKMGNTPGVNTLEVTSTGLTGSPVAFSKTGTVGGATTMTALTGTANQSATTNTEVPLDPGVTLRDALGNPVPGLTVTFTVGLGAGAVVVGSAATTNASGIATVDSWTLGPATGLNTLVASRSGLTNVTFNANAIGCTPTTIALAGGDGQNATVNTAVSGAITVLVTDATTAPCEGVAVNFDVASGGGSVSNGAQLTDVNGIATLPASSWTLGQTAGANTLTATSTGLAGSPVTFTATGNVGPAAKLIVSTPPSASPQNRKNFTTQPVVQLADQFDNPVTGPDRAITATLTSGGGGLVGTSQSTTGGVATYTDLSIIGLVGSKTITFSATGVTSATATVTLTAGDATNMQLHLGNSQSALVGAEVPIDPSVKVTDPETNLVSGTPVTFAVVLGGGSVTGGSTSSGTDGIATVGAWALGAAGTNTLEATSAGLIGSPVTFTANACTNSPASITVSSGNNQSATVGTTVSAAIAVLVTNSCSTPLAGETVTFAVATGGGAVLNGTQLTNGSGIATLPAASWQLGNTAGSNTLTATVGAVTPLVLTATGNAGAATKIVLTTLPSTSSGSGIAFATQPVAQLQDAFSNNVSTSGTTIVASITAGGGGLGGLTSVNTINGAATFTTLSISGTIGTRTLQFARSTGGLTVATANVDVTPGNPSKLVMVTQPSSAATNRVALTQQPAVRVQDAASNNVLVSGRTVNIGISGSGATVTVTSMTTDADGIATASGLAIQGTVGTRTLTFSSTSPTTITSVTSNSITTSAGAATTIAVNPVNGGNNQSALVNTAVATDPSVKVTDADGNAVQNVPVTFAVTAGGGTVDPTTAINTTSAGIAQVTSWTLGSSAGTNTMTATSGTLSGSPVTFTATATASNFDIEVRALTSLTTAQQAAFDNAETRWQNIVIGEVTNASAVTNANDCGITHPALNEVVDDLLILVRVEAIDGAGGILGQAGPCLVRGNGIPGVGIMIFDSADMSTMESNGTLTDVILHEMGHVLGIGSLWQDFGLLTGAGTSDPFFTGAQANTQFDAIGGTAYLGSGVPVENTGGAGTADGHWRETRFGNELMTGFIAAAGNPLSKLTVGSLQDMGYSINLDQADSYTYTGGAIVIGPPRPQIKLENDILKLPRRQMPPAPASAKPGPTPPPVIRR